VKVGKHDIGQRERRAQGDQQIDRQLGVSPEGLVGHDRAERVGDHHRGPMLSGVGRRGPQ
jgi:hypothetical protein